ncbi:MAG: methylenetetrahydrofolate reductase [Myxococcota bacterium]|nr:methylenetetrahydrofolate reductase [Myxococcota bacterium]
MTVASNLQRVLAAGHFAVTAECGPPRGSDPEGIVKKGKLLLGSVDACNVTDNQTAVVRMCSLAACSLLRGVGLDPVMQMVCRDRNRIAAQSDILGGAALGIRNILCLSGDHQKFGNQPQAKNVFDLDSIQLIDAARTLRNGTILGGDKLESAPALFVGAAENPFADPFAIRVPRLAKKIAAGAEFIQTQCVFNLDRFAKWMEGARARGLHEKTAVLAGVTPMKSARMAEYMATKVAGMDVPEKLVARMKGVPKDKAKAEGIAIAVETILALREMPGVRGVHVMAIEWEDAVPEIVRMAGLAPRP